MIRIGLKVFSSPEEIAKTFKKVLQQKMSFVFYALIRVFIIFICVFIQSSVYLSAKIFARYIVGQKFANIRFAAKEKHFKFVLHVTFLRIFLRSIL